MPPGHGPRFKDMKVHPEPDEASPPGSPVVPLGKRPNASRPHLQTPEERVMSPLHAQESKGHLTRCTERLTPKARMQLIEVEDVDSVDERCSDFSDHDLPRGSCQSATAANPTRPSADLTPNYRGRKAVHPASGSLAFLHVFQRRALQARYARRIGRFMESRFMLITSVCITIYALVGDDLRLLSTDKPADPWFNAISIITLLFFTVEIVLSCIGKPDYFLGFYFWLDLVATISIIFDLTWISDALTSNEDLDMGSSARSGRTAKIGAGVGRVVRVLRLMRIVKLYRAYFERITRKAPSTSNRNPTMLVPGQTDLLDDWDNEEEWEEAELAHDESHKESAVGKKLVSLSTRRVICMVLVMLLVLPYLRVDISTVSSSSPAWGADSVWQSFVAMQGNSSLRTAYEDKMLRYLYFHNWFERTNSCTDRQGCPEEFWLHVYWVGFAGKDLNLLQQKARLAQLTSASLARWDAVSNDPSLLFYTGKMPPEVRARLASPWGTLCSFGGVDHFGVSMLSTEIEGSVGHEAKCPSDLRPAESMRVHPQLLTSVQFDDWHLVFFFDKRPFTREESMLALIATFFICVVLCISTLFFSSDASTLVLKPVERMVQKVKTIANDPLIALKMADAEFELEEVTKYREAKLKTSRNKFFNQWLKRWHRFVEATFPSSKGKETMETLILEKTIIKLGSLLALGFGEAGADIVSHNMRGLDSSGVNAMIPGSRVECIIGNARIRDFSFATEVLQGKVMKFVNQIAEVVHGIVNEYHGAVNKNMGDTFLIIWRTDGLEGLFRERLADLSLIAFPRILACVHESPTLARYRGHPGLQQRLGSRFRVNLSFALHAGWAIEGAVGSEYKIDASYLSPNVSIAESLEAATRVYGVSLLTSATVVRQCSPRLASKCRLVDRVIVKGSSDPLELYALDLDFIGIKVHERKERVVWNTRQRFRARQMLEVEKRDRLAMDVDVVSQLFDFSPSVATMRHSYTEAFLQTFKMGFRNYEEGEWQTARRFLAMTHQMIGIKDGPSGYLLRYMGGSYDFEAPANWRGVHPLEIEGNLQSGGT